MLFAIIRPMAWIAIRLLYAILGGIRFEGRENVPKTGGVLIAPNHISDADPPTVGVALPRACYFMAKEELFDIRILGKLIRALHGFPVKRYSADRAALRLAEELLKAGECVVIFPEGKLSENGKLQPLLPGLLLIAQRAKVPIVPTILDGTDRIMPYGVTVPRRSRQKTIVRFGPPVSVAELTDGAKGGEALKAGAERLGGIMRALQEGRRIRPSEVILPPQEEKEAKQHSHSEEANKEAQGDAEQSSEATEGKADEAAELQEDAPKLDEKQSGGPEQEHATADATA